MQLVLSQVSNICSKAETSWAVVSSTLYHYAVRHSTSPSSGEILSMPVLFGTLPRRSTRRCSKFACRDCTKDWHTDYQCLLDGLRIPSLELRRAMRLCFMYKLIDNNAHILPTREIVHNCSITTRSTQSKQLENTVYHAIPHNI